MNWQKIWRSFIVFMGTFAAYLINLSHGGHGFHLLTAEYPGENFIRGT
jgi:hypothetical protein